jgi:multiple sugar transport system permease protein
MAAAVVFTVPIVIAFFFAQKTFIQGVKLTGMKE